MEFERARCLWGGDEKSSQARGEIALGLLQRKEAASRDGASHSRLGLRGVAQKAPPSDSRGKRASGHNEGGDNSADVTSCET